MDVLNQFLDSRDAPADWRPVALPPEERLVRFDAWLYRQLAERIDWTFAGDEVAQGRRIHQARVYVERLVIQLWRRGWLLDGKRLAARIIEPLDLVARYQKAGAICQFWPYFCATIDRHVGANAEEIQAEARSIGAAIGQVMGDLRSFAAQEGPTLPELLTRRADEVQQAAEATLREKTNALRRKQAKERADSNQLRLL